jgi:hypothetical protein
MPASDGKFEWPDSEGKGEYRFPALQCSWFIEPTTEERLHDPGKPVPAFRGVNSFGSLFPNRIAAAWTSLPSPCLPSWSSLFVDSDFDLLCYTLPWFALHCFASFWFALICFVCFTRPCLVCLALPCFVLFHFDFIYFAFLSSVKFVISWSWLII